jgi:hypothetical protein
MSDVGCTNPNLSRVTGLYFAGVLVLILTAGEAAFLAFGWPEFLRGSPAEILATLHPRVGLVFVSYYLFVISWLAFIAVPILTWRAASHPASIIGMVAVPFGCLAGLCHAIGPARWIFVVPTLAADFHAEGISQAARDAILVAFGSINQFGGEMIGEHIANLLRGVWTCLLSLSLVETLPSYLRPIGLLAAFGAIIASLEQLGGPFAGLLSSLAAIQFAWFAWGIVLSIALVRSTRAVKHLSGPQLSIDTDAP